jgi:flagellar biosynthesis/type III secretory pathway protein FliH
MSSIREWIRYCTEFWNDDHEKLVVEIVEKLIWYKPSIRKRILKEVQEALKHVKERKDGKIV